MPVPAVGITLADKHATTKALASKGATINELNTVRKHISRVKGECVSVRGAEYVGVVSGRMCSCLTS